MDSLKGTLTPMKVLNGTLNGGIAYGTFNYNELENKPSVNGTELVGNVNIDIPTKTSDLTNDSGFITNADVPTKTSELTNDSGFITSEDIPTKTSELTNDSGFITSADIPEIPTNTSQLNNDSGFLTMNTTPVRSVNSQTGDVNLFIPNATSQLNNDAGFLTESSQKITDIEDNIDTLQGDVIDIQDSLSIDKTIYNVETFGGTITALKSGNIVTLIAEGLGNTSPIPASSTSVLCQLNTKYRSTHDMFIAGSNAMNDYYYTGSRFYRYRASDGRLLVYQPAGSTIANGNFTITYIID